jgi:putative transposase
MRKQYSAQFKAEAVLELLREEKSIAEVAAEREVHPSMLIRWRRLLLDDLPQVFAREDAAGRQRSEYEKKIHELYAEIGRLTTELEWLGKKGVHFK